jgi:hypothetical protein
MTKSIFCVLISSFLESRQDDAVCGVNNYIWHLRIKILSVLQFCLIIVICVSVTYYDLIKLIMTGLDLHFPSLQEPHIKGVGSDEIL